MASILDPTYGFVWIKDDLTCSDAEKQNLIATLKEAIIREAEKLYIDPAHQQQTVIASAVEEHRQVPQLPPAKRPTVSLFSLHERRRSMNNTNSTVAAPAQVSSRAQVLKYFEHVHQIRQVCHDDP